MLAYVDPAFAAAVPPGTPRYWADGTVYRRGPLLVGTDAFPTVALAVAGGASEVWLAPGSHVLAMLTAGLELVGCGSFNTFLGSGIGTGLNLLGPAAGAYWRFDRLSLVGVAVARAVVLVSNGKAAFVRCGFWSRPIADAEPGDAITPAVEAAGTEAAAVCVGCSPGLAPVGTSGGAVQSFRPPLSEPGGSVSPDAGQLRPGYTLEAPAVRRLGTGEKGGRGTVFVRVCEFSAQQEPISSSERLVGRVVVENSTHQLRTRGGLPAAMKMRVRYRGQVWEVTDCRNWSGSRNDCYLGLSEARPEGTARE